MAAAKAGRNDPCPCGSGRKYKQCCALKQDSRSKFGTYALIAVLVAIAGVLVYTFTADGGSGSRQVWDPVHGHYHTVP
ncbi:MAG: SEC-C metal-binding domain-containing protein [Acidobacteria bacterium]|nr:SEC-C metal-binding domain-containing protein [Acidobacteriota bacterium]